MEYIWRKLHSYTFHWKYYMWMFRKIVLLHHSVKCCSLSLYWIYILDINFILHFLLSSVLFSEILSSNSILSNMIYKFDTEPVWMKKKWRIQALFYDHVIRFWENCFDLYLLGIIYPDNICFNLIQIVMLEYIFMVQKIYNSKNN